MLAANVTESPLDRRTLADSTYDYLRERLVAGWLAPGERMSLREIGAALQVSVMPVREAVNRLVAERALEVTPGRMLRVPLMSAGQLRELAAIRVVLEGFAAEQAALARSEEQLVAIAEAEAGFRSTVSAANYDASAAIASNHALHFAIYRAAGLPLLFKMISDLWLKAGPVLNLDLRAAPHRLATGSAVRHHAQGLAAIQAGHAAAARAAIAADITSAADYIIARGDLLPG